MTQEQCAMEIINKFNLHYNNILSDASPGISVYEISLYMTQALKEVVFNYYNGNSKGDTYDSNEKVKSFLSYYTVNSSILADQFTDPTNAPLVNLGCKDVTLSNNVAWVVKESIRGSVNNTPMDILVKPIDQDSFWMMVDNPFKRPNKFCSRAWRLDLTLDEKSRAIRLFYPLDLTISSYNFTYVPIPEPIIVGNLEDDGEGLTIEGITSLQVPDSLINNPLFLDVVINRAVELATRDYKENNLETQLSLNTRVE